MTATDTIVGIVGAVLLVGVMTGVFVYEYNQVDGDAATPDDDGPEPFEETFSGSFAPAAVASRSDLASEPFMLDSTYTRINVSLTVAPTGPAGDDIQWELLGGDGTVLDSGSGLSGTLSATGTFGPGQYRVTLYTESVTGGGDYEGTFEAS